MLDKLKKLRLRRLQNKRVPSEIKELILEEEYLDKFHDLKKRLNKADTGEDVKEMVYEMSTVAENIEALKGWPYDRQVFWDEDSSIWQHRINDEHRVFIRSKLKRLLKGKVLEIGCGSYPYCEGVCLDLSFDMLWSIKPSLNDTFKNPYLSRVQADLENGLPFKDKSFDTIVGVFVANYIHELSKLMDEVKRVLSSNGRMVLVQSLVPVNTSHIILEKHASNGLDYKLRKMLIDKGFKVKVKEVMMDKKSMWFIVAER